MHCIGAQRATYVFTRTNGISQLCRLKFIMMKLRIVLHNVCYLMSHVNFTRKLLQKNAHLDLAKLILSIRYFLFSLDDILCLSNGVVLFGTRISHRS